jgi:predicted alpha/beta hydrolase family esterase
MDKQLHVLYVPGLGDNRISKQLKAIRTWRWWGVTPELLQMNWADKQPWEEKFERLLMRIDKLHAQNKEIALVGASAGASAVINAYAVRKDKIAGCVLIAGKVNRPSAIGNQYRKKNPAFVAAAYSCEQALTTLNNKDRQRILSRYALVDETVYKPDSKIPGANNRLVPTVGHVITIATQLTLGAPSFIRFLKLQAKKK